MKAFESLYNPVFFDNLIDKLEDGILVIGKNGDIVRVNNALCRMSGYSKEELEDMPIFDLVINYDRSKFESVWQMMLSSGYLKIDAVHQHKEGYRYTVQVSAMMSKKGEEEFCFCIIKNVLETQKKERLLNLIENHVNQASFEWNFRPESFIYTQKLYRIVGIIDPTTHLPPYSLPDFLRPFCNDKQFEKLEVFIERLKLTTEARKEVIRVKSPTDKKIFIEIAARSELKDNEIHKIHGTIKNVTKTRRLNQIISLSKFTLDNAAEMFLWVDKMGKVIYSNRSLQVDLGYTEKELNKRKLWQLVDSATLEDWLNFWETINIEKNMLVERNLIRKDGTLHAVSVSYNLIAHKDQKFLAATIQDLSRFKIEKERLQHSLSEAKNLNNQMERENKYLKEELISGKGVKKIISKTPKYKTILNQIQQVAPTDTTVLITGETGTGKELLATSLHQLSNRASAPLVSVNCAALPPNLIESELFGHEKGAFTGAYSQKIGRFERADKATIFLDEIGELPLELQAKLLRVLQEGEISRLGGTKTLQIDTRIIAATNRNLESLVREGKFREDLYFRLSVFPIYNIPLRERKEDIPLLINHFIGKFSKRMGKKVLSIQQEAVDTLMKYNFPGNIRELENIIERAMVLCQGSRLSLDNIILQNTGLQVSDTILPFDEMIKKHIIDTLKACEWKVSGTGGAAELLEMNPKTLESKMRKYGIKRKDFMLI